VEEELVAELLESLTAWEVWSSSRAPATSGDWLLNRSFLGLQDMALGSFVCVYSF